MLFKHKENIAGKFEYIINKYPHLKANFSVLTNIKKTSKDGFTNLMLATMKLSKDDIDTFYENFQDLANSNKLLQVQGIDQRDADYIAEFFGNFPIWMYLQSGPNTKNPFSFGRVMPNDKILRILEKPVKELTELLNSIPETEGGEFEKDQKINKYLFDFADQFILANMEKSTRQRFKEFVKKGDEINEPTMQTKLFEDEEVSEELSFNESPFKEEIISAVDQMYPQNMRELINHSGGAVGADIAWDTIGQEFGAVNHIHYWMNNKTPHGNKEITEVDKIEGQKKVTEAARQMGRIEPTHQVRDERLIRNWSQVKYADAIYAVVQELLIKGAEMNYGKKAKITQGKGGTGYAIQMAINEGKPVYVFEQKNQVWATYKDGLWEVAETPILSRNFAGIGTREINDVGLMAIRSVYQKTKDYLSLPSLVEQPPLTISNEELKEQINQCKNPL